MNDSAKIRLLVCCLCVSVAALISVPLMAQTPDGETPAEETVCDPLKADGITKGLYGLCVAFCEAQDYSALNNPINVEELEALAGAAPSGRILRNYNKKKQESDPDMPCIKVEEPCPCWTAAQLASIDGSHAAGYGIALACAPTEISEQISEGELGVDGQYQAAGAWVIPPDTPILLPSLCYYFNHQESPNIEIALSVGNGLTEQQAENCLAAVNAACEIALP